MGVASLALHPDAPSRDVREAAANTDAQVLHSRRNRVLVATLGDLAATDENARRPKGQAATAAAGTVAVLAFDTASSEGTDAASPRMMLQLSAQPAGGRRRGSSGVGAGAHVYCLLAAPAERVLLGACHNGVLHCWQLDDSWGRVVSDWQLPKAMYRGVPFASLAELRLAPQRSGLVVGRSCTGSLAGTRTPGASTRQTPLDLSPLSPVA